MLVPIPQLSQVGPDSLDASMARGPVDCILCGGHCGDCDRRGRIGRVSQHVCHAERSPIQVMISPRPHVGSNTSIEPDGAGLIGRIDAKRPWGLHIVWGTLWRLRPSRSDRACLSACVCHTKRWPIQVIISPQSHVSLAWAGLFVRS